MTWIEKLYSTEGAKIIWILAGLALLILGISRITKDMALDTVAAYSATLDKEAAHRKRELKVEQTEKALPANVAKRLAEIQGIALLRAEHHLGSLKWLYASYYLFSTMAILLTGMAAVIGILATKDGWAAASKYLVVLFAASAVGGAAYTATIQYYLLPTNIQEASKAYVANMQLVDKVRSGIVNIDCGSTTPPKPCETLINVATEDLKAGDKILLNFEPKPIDLKSLSAATKP